MYTADLKHKKPSLQAKLEHLYSLSRARPVKMGFRPDYINLLKAFDNPHLKIPPTIHVAGTNGKGSTIAMLRAIYEEAGYKVHVHTSPHLKYFNERIVLAGEMIDDQTLEALVDEALEKNNGAECTFFEITTAMAFAAFSRNPADILLLETGLGGRLDCTNVIQNPLATIITSISRDHTNILGNSLEEIAYEKAGIMKPGRPCIIAKQTDQAIAEGVIDALTQHAHNIGSNLHSHGSQWNFIVNNNMIQHVSKNNTESFQRPNLLGSHQDSNFATAISCIKVIQNLPEGHEPIGSDIINSAAKRINWPARLQKLNHPLINDPSELWLDGGHNESAGYMLGEQAQKWQQQDSKDLHLILAMKNDKDPEKFLRTLATEARSITLLPLHGVGGYLDEQTLKSTNLNIETFHQAENCEQAIKNLLETYDTNIRILTCGSLYLAEQLL